jgi:hypothetical protein
MELPFYNMYAEIQWSLGKAPCILNVGTTQRKVFSFILKPLYRLYPLLENLRYGCSDEERSSHPNPESNSDCTACGVGHQYRIPSKYGTKY